MLTGNDFDLMVAEALDSLPENFGEKLENVSVEVKDWPTREDLSSVGITSPGTSLFGLYPGVPRTKRDNYSAALPDKIIIFSGPVLSFLGSDKNILKEKIRDTLLHEIGHHFGMRVSRIFSLRIFL